MGPDWFWVAVFSVGGLAMGLVTTLVGLRKGREFFGWMLLYAFMTVATVLLDVQHPFWTVLVGSLAAGLAAGLFQSLFMRVYRRKNPWYAHEMEGSTSKVAAGFIGFALFSGALFGLLVGGVAWGLSFI